PEADRGRTGPAVPTSAGGGAAALEGGDRARGDVQRGAGGGPVAAAAGVAGGEPGGRRGLDRDRLAGHDGGGGPQRVSGGRGGAGPGGPAGEAGAAGFGVNR